MGNRAARRWCVRGVLVMAAVLGTAPPLPAFTYQEHCRLSNAALAIAARFTDSVPALDSALNALHRERLRQLALGRCNPRTPESYGDLVALADYAFSPVEFYAYIPNQHTPLLLTDDDELPWNSIEAMGSWRLQNLRSAHINEDHFEDRALLSQFLWHETATHMASSRRRLMAALLINAFSDHFLQDFFAPGHIHTPRRRLHDVTALGRHDTFNRRGERFFPLRTDELASLLRLADSATAAPCRDQEPGACLRALADTGFIAGGDDSLEGRPAQRMYVTLVTARSILDVLASFATGSPVSSFAEGAWRESRVFERFRDSVDARTSEVIRVRELYELLSHAGTRYGEFRSRWNSGVEELVLGITLAHESVLSRGESTAARGVAGVEIAFYTSADVLPDDLPRGREKGSLRQLGLGLRYSVYVGDDEPMHSVGLRFIRPITEINTQFSVGGTGRFRPSNLPNIAWGIDARAEMGFGVAFLGIGVGHEWRARIPESQRSWVVTSSVSVSAPFSSLLHRRPLRRARR